MQQKVLENPFSDFDFIEFERSFSDFRQFQAIVLTITFCEVCPKFWNESLRRGKTASKTLNMKFLKPFSCLDDLSKCASMHAVTRFIAMVRFPILFESSHCSKLKFSKTINHFWIYSRLHLKSDLTAFETFSWIWYWIFSIFLTKSVSASMLRAVRSAKWETKANNRGGFSWTWSSETKFSNDIPPDPFDVMREFIRSTNNECSITDFLWYLEIVNSEI